MILDSGVCSIYHKVNIAEPGNRPRFGYELVHQSFYGERSFSTSARYGDNREAVRVDLRIRVVQCKRITNHDVVVMGLHETMPDGVEMFEVVDAFHDKDSDNGQPVTDLYLQLVTG